MRKNDLKNKMQDGFLEAAPDVYEAVLTAAGKNKFTLQNEESKKTQDSGRSHIYFRSFTKYALSACAGFALFFVCLFGMLGKNQDNIYVVLDINPSVRIVMDESCQVKKLQGLNQDGRDVIQTLEWDKKDPMLQTVERVVECAVKGDYLHEGGGILVTIFAAELDMYDELEDEMGRGIDGKLKKMGVTGVTTAFQCAEEGSGKEGRESLEAELVEKYGVNKEMLHQMSVSELIQCCQKYEAERLQLSPVSEKQKQEASDKKEGEQDKKESQKKKKEQKADTTEKKEKLDKTKPDAVDEDDKVEDEQPGNEKTLNKKNEPSVPPKGNQQNLGGTDSTQQPEAIPPSETEQPQPSVTQPEVPVQPPVEPPEEPENPPQDEDDSKTDGESEDDKGKDQNNGKKDENSGKDNNNKDNSNKNNNSNKDNNGKENSNKDNDNKNNGNKDNNNKGKDDKENGKTEKNSKNDNKDERAKDISNSCEDGVVLE